MKYFLASILAVASWAGPEPHSHAVKGPYSLSGLAFRQDMRKLWSEHVLWTRDYIVALAADRPYQHAAAERLLLNQEDIGGALALYYGHEAGEHLTALLKEHIGFALDVIKALKTNDSAKLKVADTKWQTNGDEIAAFLSQTGPNFSQPALEEMMMQHRSTTAAEVEAYLSKDWARDMKAFDEVYRHCVTLADALSDAIITQFPDKFAQ